MADTPTAPHGLLAGKTGIVFGALNESSLAWHIAEAIHREGGRFALTNAPVAQRLGEVDALAERTGAPVVWADATSADDLARLFDETTAHFGHGVDFIVHSIGMGFNVRKNRPYEDLNHEWFLKTLDVSAASLHRTITAGLKKDALNDGGSIVALSYVGAQRTFSRYSEMGDAKALLESIVRSYGYRLAARGIRINSVSQSPTKTSAGAGIKGFDLLYAFADTIAPMGNADSESCADYVVTLLSDYTRMVTMQNLFHDGGFAAMGVSDKLLEVLGEGLLKGQESSALKELFGDKDAPAG